MDPRERLNDPEEATRAALDGRQARIRTAMPGIVSAVDLEKQTVSVQPAVQGMVEGSDGSVESVNLPLLVDVPIVWPRAGKYAVTFPVKVGDEVLVCFGDRCIDNWWQSGGVGTPAEPRMHDLSDAFAILAPTSQPKVLPNVSSTAVQVRNESGTSYIEITDDEDINLKCVRDITMQAGRDVKVTAARDYVLNATARNLQTSGAVTTLTAAGIMSLLSSGGLVFGATGGAGVTMNTGPVTWNPASFVMNSTGAIALASPAGSHTHNGKNIGDTHVHTGVTTGGGNSGVPL